MRKNKPDAAQIWAARRCQQIEARICKLVRSVVVNQNAIRVGYRGNYKERTKLSKIDLENLRDRIARETSEVNSLIAEKQPLLRKVQ